VIARQRIASSLTASPWVAPRPVIHRWLRHPYTHNDVLEEAIVKPMPKKATLAGVGAAGVLALALAVPAVASAQDPSGSPSATPSSSASASPSDREQHRAARQQKLVEGLAAELGIPQDKVAAALEKVQQQLENEARTERQNQLKQRLDQAVSEGKITQEQADAILKASEAGVLGGLGGPGRGHGPGPGR
jgi:hypothetical protein